MNDISQKAEVSVKLLFLAVRELAYRVGYRIVERTIVSREGHI